MAQLVTEGSSYSNQTVGATVNGPQHLLGIFVSSSSGGTFQVNDGGTAITGVVAANGGTFYPIPAYCTTSIVVAITGTINYTILYSGQ